MGFVVPLTMFAVAVVGIFYWGLRDKRSRKNNPTGSEAARPQKAA